MLRVALTGGIATGKSYVLVRFASLGAPVVDADRLAREAVRRGTRAWQQIRERFGDQVLGPDGEIDRSRLATIVFADEVARRDLEAAIHPEVYRRISAWFAEQAAADSPPFGIADIPLLFETGHEGDFDRVIVTVCDAEEQVRRIVARDGLSEEEARRRIATQWPAVEKAARGDFVVRTDMSPAETDRQVEEIYRTLAGCRSQ